MMSSKGDQFAQRHTRLTSHTLESDHLCKDHNHEHHDNHDQLIFIGRQKLSFGNLNLKLSFFLTVIPIPSRDWVDCCDLTEWKQTQCHTLLSYYIKPLLLPFTVETVETPSPTIHSRNSRNPFSYPTAAHHTPSPTVQNPFSYPPQ